MKKTTDLWLAGFIVLQGEAVADYKRIGPRKVEFTFDVSTEQWKKYRLQYLSSEFAKLNQEINKLRELYYE